MASESSDHPRGAPTAGGGDMREVLTLALPVILTQLSMTAMGFIDAAMVGRLGATELGAVGFAGIWIWTALNFFFGTASGVQTFVAQAWGAGRERECGAWVWQALWVVVPAVTATAIALVVAVEPGLRLAGPSEEFQRAAARYAVPALHGAPALAVAMALASFFRGFGDTRTPLYATIVANVVNAVLDYGLIFGRLGLPELGVAGAGTATAIGQWVQAVMLALAFGRRGVRERYATRPARPDARAIRRFLYTGAPIGGQWVVGMASFSVFTTLIARMGDSSAAASQAFVVLLSFSFMQAIGISVAAATLVGRYVGSGAPDAVRRSFWSAQKLAGVLAGGIALAYVAAPELLLRIFTADPAVLQLGRRLVMLGALFQLCDAFGIVAEGALRGAGDTRWPFAVHSALAWGLFLPTAYLFGVELGGGVAGAWLAGILYVACGSSAYVWRFRSGAWERIEV